MLTRTKPLSKEQEEENDALINAVRRFGYFECHTDPRTGDFVWRANTRGAWHTYFGGLPEASLKEIIGVILKKRGVDPWPEHDPEIDGESETVKEIRAATAMVDEGVERAKRLKLAEDTEMIWESRVPERHRDAGSMYEAYKINLKAHGDSAMHRARRAVYYESLARACNVQADALLFPRTHWVRVLKEVKEKVEKVRSLGPRISFSIKMLEGEDVIDNTRMDRGMAGKALLEYEGWVSRAIDCIDQIRKTEGIEGDADDPCEPPSTCFVME